MTQKIPDAIPLAPIYSIGAIVRLSHGDNGWMWSAGLYFQCGKSSQKASVVVLEPRWTSRTRKNAVEKIELWMARLNIQEFEIREE